jgi:hypothetical protein
VARRHAFRVSPHGGVAMATREQQPVRDKQLLLLLLVVQVAWFALLGYSVYRLL